MKGWNRYDDKRINNDVLFLIKCLLTVIEDYREKIITDEVKNDLNTLMRILAEDRKEVPNEVTELVAKFGEEAVDQLIEVLEEDNWGSVRAAEALGIIAAPKATFRLSIVDCRLMIGIQSTIINHQS